MKKLTKQLNTQACTFFWSGKVFIGDYSLLMLDFVGLFGSLKKKKALGKV